MTWLELARRRYPAARGQAEVGAEERKNAPQEHLPPKDADGHGSHPALVHREQHAWHQAAEIEDLLLQLKEVTGADILALVGLALLVLDVLQGTGRGASDSWRVRRVRRV